MGTTGNTNLSKGLTPTDLEMLKLQTKYAWDVWEFAGRQRMNMFNYSLLATGILVNGYLMALKEESIRGVLLFICSLGMLQCIAFFMMDIRSRKLLYFADGLLKHLENDYLFDHAPYRGLGPMNQRDEEQPKDWWLRNSKMQCWIRVTYIFVFLGFLGSLVHSVWLLLRA